MADPVERRPLRVHDIENMRRSLVAGGLPDAQTRWLLDEAHRLLVERNEARVALARLGEPWCDVRAALNEVHRIIAD